MATISETIHVKGIRCERCVARLAHVLKGHEGLEAANAALNGAVSVVYDDAVTSRQALVKEFARGGFHEQQPV